MAGKPSLQWYPGDWFKAEEVRACSPATRGIWFDFINYAFNSQSFGAVTGTIPSLARRCGATIEEMEHAIEEIELNNVGDVSHASNGVVTVVCRRLQREQEEREGNAEYMREYRARKRESDADDNVDDAACNDDVDECNPNVSPLKDACTSRAHAEGEVEEEIDTSSKVDEGKSGSPRAREPEPDYEAVMDSWNEFAEEVGLPVIRTMTRKRRAAVRVKYRDVWPHIEAIYRQIRGSPFLLGTGGRDSWRGATFDFVWLREDNYTRILEGAYGKKNGRQRPGETRKEAFQRFRRATGSAGSEERGGMAGARDERAN